MRTLVASLLVLVAALTVLGTPPTHASVPGSMEITCDVDRKQFRPLASTETQVTFNLWDAQTLGNSCDSRVMQMKDLVIIRSKTDTFDSQRKPRRFDSIRAVIGSDASPVQLCSGPETWLDVTVGTTTLTCDFSADDDRNNPPPPPPRKRMHSVASAQQVQPPDISLRVLNDSDIPIPDSSPTVLSFNSERWDTGCAVPGMHDPANPTRLTACAAGKYLIFGQVRFDSSGSGYRLLDIMLDRGTPGETIIARQQVSPVGGGATTVMEVATHYNLAVNDFVEIRAEQTSGISLDATCNPSLCFEFGMVKLP